ncbi:MAG: VCBS repeat-containing protein [Pyrinomonadaceae bacterium]
MKKYFYGFAVLIMAVCLLSADSLAQCGAVGFEVSSIGTVGNSMNYRTVLDFNGDGRLDFAGDYDNGSGQLNNVTILQNNGAGGFTPITLTVSNSGGGTFWGAEWADFNADGRPDALAYFSTAPTMVVFYNDGNGGLTRGNSLAFDSPYEYVSASDDVNHDGRVDFITTGAPNPGADEPNYYLYLSTGDGIYAPRVHIITEHANLFFGDFNGDGNKDIAINKSISNSNNYTLKYWMQNAAGSFTQTPEIFLGHFRIEGVDEFNRDGKDDFYGTTSFSTTVSFLLSNASGGHTASDVSVNYKDGTYRMYFGDFNGDGMRDVLDSGRASDASYGYTALFGNGAGAFHTFSNAFSLDDQNYNRVAQAIEFTGDGKTDLVRFSNDLTNNRTNIDLLKSVCLRGVRATPSDFDGDGKTDISIYRPAVGEWWYLKSSNGGNAAFQFGSSADKIVPADFNGDGKTDVAVFRPVSGEWFILRSEDQSYYSFPFGTNGDIPAPADFDGDGKADAAVFRASDSTWYINKSSGGTIIKQFGASADVPAAADYDGDGKSDIAIWRASAGEWWIQKSSDSSVVAFQFGNSADKPVQGDYTGDGKADVAIWRPSTGEWFILRSENQSYYSFPFGTNGDIPAPGDFDGDGRFDATVFRSSNATWYSQRAGAAASIQGFGQNGDMPAPGAFVP